MKPMTIIVTNAFSLNMVECEENRCTYFRYEKLPLSMAKAILKDKRNTISSAIGHADTASLFSSLLEYPLTADRKTITLTAALLNRPSLLIGQYSGPRLPEGATSLPEGAKIEWWLAS